MKKFILSIILMSAGYIGFAQQLTCPQIEGYPSGSTINVSFPFTIKGIPFSQIPGSIWKPNSSIVAELTITYYMEGDATKYVNKTVKFVSPSAKMGSWIMDNLMVERTGYPIPDKRVLHEKTTYLLSIYQSFAGKRSAMWYANIHRDNLQVNKLPDQKRGPINVHLKDKVTLNPQPIPPKTSKKSMRAKGF